ncbi:MAG: Mov34/MPN/PAD-1 family protein [Thermoguttaceae bacterium]|nr:Mov34/MPN/PAD-1 family protein [Thermoguttaceae bacterium]MDW8037209.1 Mov34/MPN/PAD-1 family protein [Thermoguttaceae bacterium]
MKRRRKVKHQQPTSPVPSSSAASSTSSQPTSATTPTKYVRRTFPGPQGQKVALRVAMERQAYAEITAHAKESLDQEVCGILAGEVCQDDEGLFVHVQAAIRGAATKAGGAHVTFTQETWNQIHSTLEKEYPKLRIVGWYHSHPGFGVAFSDMDRFIHENFFPSPTHVALLTDPLGGEVALAINGPAGLQYLDRFWVDARQQKALVPAHSSESTESSGQTGLTDWPAQLEQRLGQLIQTVDELRTLHGRFLMALFLVACLTAVISIGYQIYSKYAQSYEPPERLTTVPVPIQIGDKTVMLLIGVDGWAVPPEITAAYIQLEKERQQQLEEAAQKAKEKIQKAQAGTSPQEKAAPPSPQPTPPPPTSPSQPKPGPAQPPIQKPSTEKRPLQPPGPTVSPEKGLPQSPSQQPSPQKAPPSLPGQQPSLEKLPEQPPTQTDKQTPSKTASSSSSSSQEKGASP